MGVITEERWDVSDTGCKNEFYIVSSLIEVNFYIVGLSLQKLSTHETSYPKRSTGVHQQYNKTLLIKEGVQAILRYRNISQNK